MLNIFKILHFSHDDNTFYTRLMIDICFFDLGRFYTSFFFLLQGSKYYNWNAHEPNNLGTENCVEMNFMNHAGKWNDRRCSTLVRFICQKPASKNYPKN